MIREIVSALLLVSVIAEDMFPTPETMPGKCPTPTNVMTSAEGKNMPMVLYEQFISKEYVKGKDCKCVKATASKGADGVINIKKELIKEGKPATVDVVVTPVAGQDGWFTHKITAVSTLDKLPASPDWATKMKSAMLKTSLPGVFVGWGCTEMDGGHIELITVMTELNKAFPDNELQTVKDGLKGFTSKLDLQQIPICP